MLEGDLDKTIDAYATCLAEIYEQADYFEVNVSSPNTPELRRLQGENALRKIILRLAGEKLSRDRTPNFLGVTFRATREDCISSQRHFRGRCVSLSHHSASSRFLVLIT